MAKRNFSSRQGGQWNDDGFASKKMRTPDEVAVKFLLPNVVVGALLSRKAAALKRIRDQTCYNKNFVLKLSGKDQFYPGTKDERMIALVGPPPLVHRACCLLQDQVIDDPFLVTDESGTNDMGPRQGQMKLAVSDRAASKIIGSKGAVVKDISGHFNIAITITPSKEVIVPDERIVTILGPSRNVFDALEPIMHQISQQQTHISPEFEYYSQYNKPEGVKDEDKDQSSKPADAADAPKADDKEESKAESDETADVKTEESEETPVVKEEPEETPVVKEESDETPVVKEEPEEAEPEKEEEGEGQSAESKTAEDSAEVKVEAEETGENAAVSQEDDKTTDDKPSEDKPSEETKKENKDDAMKKLLKDPRKDGRWIWQSDRNNRPKWVWVENQKNSTHHNYSSQGSRRGRGGFRNRGGRY